MEVLQTVLYTIILIYVLPKTFGGTMKLCKNFAVKKFADRKLLTPQPSEIKFELLAQMEREYMELGEKIKMTRKELAKQKRHDAFRGTY